MARKVTKKLSKKQARSLRKFQALQAQTARVVANQVVTPVRRTIALPAIMMVRNFADLAGIPVPKVIEVLLKNGVKATINESIDFETAAIIGDELNLEIVPAQTAKIARADSKGGKLISRTPIVAVMGHVDHGKTKLLDVIRQTNVVGKESGGITQHIGAYQVEVKTSGGKRKITFLDTPGHEAFASLRAHGANITDLVILVVAADDGVKPQTLEAISHARAANVPIVVAINKIDLPQADPQRVQRELATQNLLPVQWGGKTPIVEISAKQSINIDRLLDEVLKAADQINPVARQGGSAQGAIVDAHVDAGAGPVVTALVTNGSLKIADFIAAGRVWGKVRFMKDWQGNRVDEAKPGMPVVVGGLKSLPEFGDTFSQADSEQQAREKTASYSRPSLIKKVTRAQEAAGETLNLIVKADVSASLEAIISTIAEMKAGTVATSIISSGIGPVLQNDIKLAAASGAKILAFRVPVAQEIRKLADLEKVTIERFDIIYQLTDAVQATLKGLIEPKFVKKETGRLSIVKVFMQAQGVALVGGKVTSDGIKVADSCYISRGDEEIGEGKLLSLQKVKTPVQELGKNFEGGVRLTKKTPFKIREGDVLVTFQMEKIDE